MKKTVYIISTLAIVLSFVSCDSMLNKEPYGQFTAAQLDEESIEGLMAAAYAGLEAHFFGNNEAFAGPSTNWIFDVRSDDAYKGGGGITMEANIHMLETAVINSDNVSCFNKWQNNYFAIARVHQAMNAVKKAAPENQNELIGELKVLRAWYYFDLIRIFERIPYFTETENPNEARHDAYSREQIFEFIKNDLTEAYGILPAKQADAGRFGKYVAAAMLVKVNAFIASWKDVEEWADVVINSGMYELYPNFADMSKIEFNNRYESIMAIQFSTANNNAHINWSNLLNTTYSDGNLFGNGDDFFLASQNLVNAFRTDANGLPYLDDFNKVKVDDSYTGNVDPRLDLTVGRIGMPFRGHTYTAGWCRAYDVYGEYSGKKGLIDPSSPDMVQGFPWGASGLNFCLIRYADILLLKAEALIEQGKDLESARTLINQVREKAARSVVAAYSPQDLDPTKAHYYVAAYPAANWTREYARKAVRMERRLELAMEGNRWFDLVRWGVVVEVMNEYFQTESVLRPYYAGATMSSNSIFLPIPLVEVENGNGLYGEVGE